MKSLAIAAFCSVVILNTAAVAQQPLNPQPSRVVGQTSLQVKGLTPNLVEGRELFGPQGIAIDRSVTPSPLYVADTFNNRVLGWRDATNWTNGAPADLVLGQLDRQTTLPQGPGSSRATGLTRPTGLAVDAQGNLYVYDAGNNRVLRYPAPFAVPEEFRSPNMVIGQATFTTRQANSFGLNGRSLATTSGNDIANSRLAFDPSGNLYVTDPYNHRVLRFPARVLTEGRNGPEADAVLGQTDLALAESAPQSAEGRLDKSKLRLPSGLAVDASGRVYVGDSLARVLVYLPGSAGITTGQAATRLLGLFVAPQGQTPPRANPYTIEQPEGLFMIGNSLAVVDRSLNRVIRYDPYDQWPAETPGQPSPPARAVIGQTDFAGFRVNQNFAQPTAATLALPVDGTLAGSDVLIADSGNHRVLAFPNQGATAIASRVLGQDDFSSGAPNLLEGREMYVFAGLADGRYTDGAGIAIDRRSEAPRLYVADTYNNRILGYRDARRVKAGDRADIVIGQLDLRHDVINSPSNDPTTPTVTGLAVPAGVAVDANGALWVADAGNGRVLRFPDPFQTADNGRPIVPDVVLGQQSLTTRQIDPTSRVMGRPFGVALTADGSVVVSDAAFHRVLLFRRPAGGDLVSGQAADKVIGQPDFFTATSGSSAKKFLSPRHIAIDTDDRLYVADAGNNRIVIFNRITDPREPNDPFPVLTLGGVTSPHGLFVSPTTGELWVGEPSAGRAQRFPRFDRLSITSQSDYAVASERPLAITQDALGMLYLLEGANRVTMFYTLAAPTNAASGNDTNLAPGTIASIYAQQGSSFGSNTASAGAPYPLELGDTQVLVDEQPAPLIYVSPGQINFIVPQGARTGGRAEYLVVEKSTGQVRGSGTLDMSPVAPALFSSNGSGSGQLAALNFPGNTVNSPSNPIGWGQVIQLFATGQGFVPGAPADGAAPAGAVPTDEKPRVIIGTDFVPPENVEYSGLAPGLPGVWQINVKIPNNVVPGPQVDLVVQFKGRNSNVGKGGQRVRTTIAVKQ